MGLECLCYACVILLAPLIRRINKQHNPVSIMKKLFALFAATFIAASAFAGEFPDISIADLKKAIAALSAEAKLKSQAGPDKLDTELIKQGRALITGDFACTDCHSFGKKDPDATAPDLTGYGSKAWLVRFIGNPAHADFYGKRNDRMPAFGADGRLTAEEIGLLVDWLRGEWYVEPQAQR